MFSTRTGRKALLARITLPHATSNTLAALLASLLLCLPLLVDTLMRP